MNRTVVRTSLGSPALKIGVMLEIFQLEGMQLPEREIIIIIIIIIIISSFTTKEW